MAIQVTVRESFALDRSYAEKMRGGVRSRDHARIWLWRVQASSGILFSFPEVFAMKCKVSIYEKTRRMFQLLDADA